MRRDSSTFQNRLILLSSRRTLRFILGHVRLLSGGGGGYDGGKEAWLLSRVLAVPTRGSFQARVNRLRRRGHVGFTEEGDLYVADSVGRMVWSLAEEGEREVERQKRGGVEEKTIYSTFSTFHKTITIYRLCGYCTVYSRRGKPVETTATVQDQVLLVYYLAL